MELALYKTRQQLQSLVRAPRAAYEWANILDRLMINLYNREPDAVAKARSECEEKHIDSGVVSHVVRALRAVPRTITTRAMCAGELPKPLREMYVFLKQRYPDVSEDALTRCTLRYASLGMGGQQWALGRAMMARIRAAGITVEAFASPFNNYFPVFYSIFRADEPFGSRGSFFDAPLSELKAFYANPPFTPLILERMSEKVCAATVHHAVRAVIITPTWSDAPWYRRLAGCGFQPRVRANETYFRLGEEFQPQFKTTIWTRGVDLSAE